MTTSKQVSVRRAVSLFAALLIAALCVFSAAAAANAADGGAETTAVQDASAPGSVQDGVVQEDDMRIDLNLTTTLIIIFCSVVTLGLVIVTVILARRNRS